MRYHQHSTGRVCVSGYRWQPWRGVPSVSILTACIASRTKDGEIHLPEPLLDSAGSSRTCVQQWFEKNTEAG